jgi:hypothetical protein
MAVGFKPYHGGGAESKAVGFALTESQRFSFAAYGVQIVRFDRFTWTD